LLNVSVFLEKPPLPKNPKNFNIGQTREVTRVILDNPDGEEFETGLMTATISGELLDE